MAVRGQGLQLMMFVHYLLYTICTKCFCMCHYQRSMLFRLLKSEDDNTGHDIRCKKSGPKSDSNLFMSEVCEREFLVTTLLEDKSILYADAFL